MKRSILTAALAAALLFFGAAATAQTSLVASPLNQELARIFPELSQGYIDFNGSGKPDQTSDLNEVVPESRVKDGQLQAQEILDFVVANWRFIPLAKLKAVQTAVKGSSGALGELIAIDFSTAIEDAINQREAMGDLLYLTPSAYREAMSRIGGIITTMATAYRKEGAKAESDFVAARDSLFGLIEKGYPLPQDIPAEERATLSTAMVSTILKEKGSNAARTRSAIRTLGQLKSTDAATYLLGLVDGPDYQIEAMRALGDIGYKPALPALIKQLKTAKDGEARKAALLALGAIGGTEGLDAILDLLKPANRAGLPKDLLQAAAQALSGIALKGNTDPRIQATLRELAATDDPVVRKASVAGLGAFPGTTSSDALLAVLNGDRDSVVRTQAVAALNKTKSDQVVPAFMKVLREKDLDPGLKMATIAALGDNPAGAQAIPILVESLADRNDDVRAAASAALRKLYQANVANQTIVTGGLTRSLLASQDPAFLADGTALLALLADPTTLTSLLTLLQNPLPEVRRNVTWAMYRIRSAANPRVLDELQKLITNENETIMVRANAIRAVGAIGIDSPQLNLWQTLVTTAQMRGDKYATLRFFAVRSLGQLGAGRPQVVAALARIAQRETDTDLRKEAVTALRNMAVADPGAEDALVASFAQADDADLKVLILEALADMGSDRPASLAGPFLAPAVGSSGAATLVQKRRVVTALSEHPDEASATAILDAARDKQVTDFAEAVLEGYPASFMASLVERRLRTETDKNVISALNILTQRFSE
jgi:HEAT repeat protein